MMRDKTIRKKPVLFNAPIAVTLFRMALIPIFAVSFYLPYFWANYLTIFLFILLSVTDWLDGFLARYMNQITEFGAFLDPVADKLAVTVALVILVAEQPEIYMVIPAIIIIAREIAVSALREWMSELGMHSSVSVSTIGKVKTTFQFLAILLLINNNDFFIFSSEEIELYGIFLLYVASFLTLWSMFYYLNAAWQNFKD